MQERADRPYQQPNPLSDRITVIDARVAGLNRAAINKTLFGIATADRPKDTSATIRQPFVVGEDVFNSTVAVMESAEALMGDGITARITGLSSRIEEFEGAGAGRSVIVYNDQTNESSNVGYILPAQHSDLRFLIFNNGLVLLGAVTPRLKAENTSLFNPNPAPVVVETNGDVRDSSGFINDEHAVEVAKRFRDVGFEVMYTNTNDNGRKSMYPYVLGALNRVEELKDAQISGSEKGHETQVLQGKTWETPYKADVPYTDGIDGSPGLSEDDEYFIGGLGKLSEFMFTLGELAEGELQNDELGLYVPDENGNNRQIGFIKHMLHREDQDLVILNNGVVWLIGPDERPESTTPYRENIVPLIFPKDILLTEDKKVTEEGTAKMKDLIESHVEAQILLTSEVPEHREQLYQYVIDSLSEQGTFVRTLDEEVRLEKIAEKAKREAGNVIRTAEMLVWDAELDDGQSPPSQ